MFHIPCWNWAINPIDTVNGEALSPNYVPWEDVLACGSEEIRYPSPADGMLIFWITHFAPGFFFEFRITLWKEVATMDRDGFVLETQGIAGPSK